MELTEPQALALRLRSLLLTPRPGRPADVAATAEWFGAMQGQDLASLMWSLGLRLPGRSSDDLHTELEQRTVLRTWPMRGTVHLVPSRDAKWMLELMGPRVLAGAAQRRKVIGLTEETADRAEEVLRAALTGGGRLTRAQCRDTLTSAGIGVEGQQLYHLLWYASQRGTLCIAPHVGAEQSFVLLDEWAPEPHRPERDEALATIALRYFRSHGPTTRQDFAGWTGLTAADCRRGIALAGDALAAVRVGGVEMMVDATLLDAVDEAPGDDFLALPGFDEYLLGFKDRALMLDPAHKQAVIPGGNGVFQSTLVRAGRVVGTWRRTVRAKQISIEVRPLVPFGTADRARAETAFAPYGEFTGRPLAFSWS